MSKSHHLGSIDRATRFFRDLGFWLRFAKVAAVVNGILAPPLVAMVTWLTSRSDIMGKHVNPPI
jgi:Mn2+/Fe2+ NRAMP family transporter